MFHAMDFKQRVEEQLEGPGRIPKPVAIASSEKNAITTWKPIH